jgi:hypothetical protein
MLDPDLSKTVPEKLPVAWPYDSGETASANAHAKIRKNILFLIAHILSASPLMTAAQSEQENLLPLNA